MQELHPLPHSILMLRGRAGHVAARSRETGNEAATYGVADDREDDRDRCGRIFCGQRRRGAPCCNYRHVEFHELSSEQSELVSLPVCPPILDGDVTAIRPTMVLKPLNEDRRSFVRGRRCRRPQETDDLRWMSIRRRHERRGECKENELAPLHF